MTSWVIDPFDTFQSTHPVWGATRSFRGSRVPGIISIHAPRVGCDVDAAQMKLIQTFQSTHPVWGATKAVSILRIIS